MVRNLAAALFVTLLLLFLSPLDPFEVMERRFLDLALWLRGPEMPRPEIVVVEIDDASLQKIGSWPWPRSYHAALLRVLKECKPAVIFYDMIFSEESTPEEDLALAEEIGSAGNVILAYFFSSQDPETFSQYPANLPIPIFKEKAAGLAFVNVFPDSDGHMREITLTVRQEKQRALHASLAAVAAYRSWSERDLEQFDGSGPTFINFPGPYPLFQVIPFDELIKRHEHNPAGLESLLRGKIILIGLTASGTVDLKPTVYSALYPGVGVQASMVHTLLSGKLIRRIAKPVQYAGIFLISILILAIASTQKPLKAFFYAAAALLLAFGLTQLIFQYFLIWIPFFGTALAGSVLYVTKSVSQLIRTRYETDIMGRELSLASKIQHSFLPGKIPEIPGLDIAAYFFPARQVGGDLYDILPLDLSKWGICVGDVSGKGVPAALFMAKVISEFRREADLDPSKALSVLNTKIANEGPGGMFLTLLYLIVDPATREFRFSSGGHEPVVNYRKRDGRIELLATQEGMPLGVLPDGTFDTRTEHAAAGDVLVFMSDGVKESMNHKKEIFGFDRIKAAVAEAAGGTAKEIAEHLLLRIREFVKNSPQHDDLTLVCVKFL